MHQMADDLFLLSLRQIIKIQHIPKDDEEEQKELDLKKQYELFTREAGELHDQLEDLLDEAKDNEHKIEEALTLFEQRREEMSQRFKKLGTTGA